MLGANSTIHLTRGRHTLTIAGIGKRFVGLVDGIPYIADADVDRVVRSVLMASGKMSRQLNDGDPGLVEAAKRFAGDAGEDAAPLSNSERAAMAEVRRQLPRPSANDVTKEAAKLAKARDR